MCIRVSVSTGLTFTGLISTDLVSTEFLGVPLLRAELSFGLERHLVLVVQFSGIIGITEFRPFRGDLSVVRLSALICFCRVRLRRQLGVAA